MPTGSLNFSGLSLNLSNFEKVADETETENIKERDVFQIYSDIVHVLQNTKKEGKHFHILLWI